MQNLNPKSCIWRLYLRHPRKLHSRESKSDSCNPASTSNKYNASETAFSSATLKSNSSFSSASKADSTIPALFHAPYAPNAQDLLNPYDFVAPEQCDEDCPCKENKKGALRLHPTGLPFQKGDCLLHPLPSNADRIVFDTSVLETEMGESYIDGYNRKEEVYIVPIWDTTAELRNRMMQAMASDPVILTLNEFFSEIDVCQEVTYAPDLTRPFGLRLLEVTSLDYICWLSPLLESRYMSRILKYARLELIDGMPKTLRLVYRGTKRKTRPLHPGYSSPASQSSTSGEETAESDDSAVTVIDVKEKAETDV